MNEASKHIIKSLKALEKTSSLSLNELRVVTALERVVSRIESSKLSGYIIFKGGFVLFKVYDSTRFTRDVDAIGKGIDLEEIKKEVPKVLSKDLNDGVWFGDVKIQDILDQDEYGGIRFSMAFQIGDPPAEDKVRKLSRVHFDIGVGDFVPDDLEANQTKLLSDKENFLSWKVYPPEYIFSEKLETLVSRGDAMSRAKDIYDLIWLFDRCSDKIKLSSAIENTFLTRETEIPKSWNEFISSISPELIQKSWGSIQFLENEISFDDAWNSIKKIFKQLI